MRAARGRRSATVRGAALLLVTIGLLMIQGVLFGADRIRVDVGLAIVVFLALERAVIPGASWAIVVGYLNDVFAGSSRGLYGSAFVIVFFVLRLIASQLAGGGVLFVSALGLLASLLSIVLMLLLERFLGPGTSTVAGLSPALPSLMLGALVLSYPIYRLLKRVDDQFTEPEDDLVFRG
jgi:hypothetical protein